MQQRRPRRCPCRSGRIRASADILPLFGSKLEENARLFVVHNSGIAILFCVITMLGWGSWANTQKLAGKEKWPFELFYWDYAIGVFLFSLIFATFGGAFALGPGVAPALISGAIFNLANILLVVSIDAAGMSVAFPVGIGLALVIGTVESYVETPKGNPSLLFAGVALIVFAMIMSAASRQTVGKNRVRGLIFSIIAGCIMGLFYPQLMRAIGPGKLTPYVALVFFGA